MAQPLFALLHKSPEFLAARGALGFDIVSFAVILVVLPPALLLAVELSRAVIAGRAARCTWPSWPRSRRWSFAGAINRSGGVPGGVLIVLSAAIGIAAAAAYARIAVVRSFLNVPVGRPAPVPGAVPLPAPVSGLAFPSQPGARSIGGAVRAPIVVVLFDELPLSSLWTIAGMWTRSATRPSPTRADLNVVPQRVRGVRLDRARAAVRSWTATTRPRASCRSPADHRQPVHAVRQDAPDERLRGGHRAVPARAVRGPASRGALRRAHEVDGLGPRPRLAAHGLARRGSRRSCRRCPTTGAASPEERASRTARTCRPTSLPPARGASTTGSGR